MSLGRGGVKVPEMNRSIGAQSNEINRANFIKE